MNTKTDELNFVLRRHWSMLAFWLVGSGGILVFFLIISPLLPLPGWVRVYFLVMPTVGLLIGLVLSFAAVRVSSAGLANRHFRRWFVRWEDVAAWSQLGPGGSVYIRTKNGRTHGFSSWCV